MGKISLVIVSISILLMSNSCDSGCNDCGSYSTELFSVENKLNDQVLMRFSKSNEVSGQLVTSTEDGTVAKDGFNTLFQLDVTGSYGFLSQELYFTDGSSPYNSVQFIINDTVVASFKPGDCDQSNNPFCAINFVEIRNDVDIDGNTSIEHRLTVQ